MNVTLYHKYVRYFIIGTVRFDIEGRCNIVSYIHSVVRLIILSIIA